MRSGSLLLVFKEDPAETDWDRIASEEQRRVR